MPRQRATTEDLARLIVDRAAAAAASKAKATGVSTGSGATLGGSTDQPPAITATLGPFFVAALPGTATTQAQLGVYTGATAVALTSNELVMQRSGRVIGCWIVSDAARTAGTATVNVRVNGTPTAFTACALDGTNVTSDSAFDGTGVDFAAGDAVGAAVETSGWTPTTANVAVWLLVQWQSF